MLSTRTLAIGGALAVIAAIAIGAAVWWFAIREDDELATAPQDIPEDLVQTTATPGADQTPSAPEGVLSFRVIPEESEAAYFADEELASLPLPSTAKGATQDIEGEFHINAEGGLATELESSFTVDLTGLTSDEQRRDNRVQNALNTAQYPTATFTFTEVTGFDPSIAEGEEQNLQLTGVLDLHGVQNEVTWDVQAVREANVISALATVNFLYADFGITPPNIAGFVSVADNVRLQMQIIAELV